MIAARFHVGLARPWPERPRRSLGTHGCKTIVLCGGVFQNKLLLEATDVALAAHGVEVLTPALFPAGDGAISLGQTVIAAARRLPHRAT